MCDTSATAIIVVYEKASKVLQLGVPLYSHGISQPHGTLSEWEWGQSHMPDQIKHELAESSGSQARLNAQ